MYRPNGEQRITLPKVSLACSSSFTLHAAIEKQFANNSKLYVAFIDFEKVYDTVNRNILWSVLFHSGFQGKMLRNLKAMYRSVQASVMSKSEVSGYFECFQGLKQGCVASPVLFFSADK